MLKTTTPKVFYLFIFSSLVSFVFVFLPNSHFFPSFSRNKSSGEYFSFDKFGCPRSKNFQKSNTSSFSFFFIFLCPLFQFIYFFLFSSLFVCLFRLHTSLEDLVKEVVNYAEEFQKSAKTSLFLLISFCFLSFFFRSPSVSLFLFNFF